MSMYFFRLHNLRRQAEEVRKKRQKGRSSQSGQRGTNSTDQSQPTAGSMHCCNRVHRGPSKLFERAPLQPSDSLDEIAFQIPRVFLAESEECVDFDVTEKLKYEYK
ncbi:uncharacterized protein LOC143305144 [Bombus vancouverensis nearcticus]|uniref:uncharacterized protein LOC143305144 n=1 Tax=Bombus vancouverensis nearcticus TaxID=2705178 RepID=UPI0021453311